MNFQRHSRLIGYLTVAVFVITGCSTPSASTPTPNATTHQSHQLTTVTHADGTVISITSIKVLNTKGLNTYKMMYWSDNTETEAFLAVPTAKGTYPLVVECHGGSATASSETHAYNFNMGASALSGAQPNAILLLPQYRGYDGSKGTVHGLYGDTLDTNNAIKAVMSRYSVEQGHIYLAGVSMGGGVVLKLASERSDIRSVIAISPWVGMAIVGEWASKHKSDGTSRSLALYDAMLSYGTKDPHSPVLKKESIDYKKIKAPVLLLQGTGDATVPWQTVQTFFNDLRAHNTKAKLTLFPGGQHGLHGKYQGQVNQDMTAWYKRYFDH